MNLHGIGKIKGFMPPHEGKALIKWASEFSIKGMIMEIGTYCGKSSIYLSVGAKKNNQTVFTLDHHLGSEEHQINEEYFDKEIYDYWQPNSVHTINLESSKLFNSYDTILLILKKLNYSV